MMNLKTFWIYIKIFFMGNKDFLDKGYASIPCKSCNQMFTSYPHYKKFGTYSIDTKCSKCRKKEK